MRMSVAMIQYIISFISGRTFEYPFLARWMKARADAPAIIPYPNIT
jgi:hypothetical protein